jgi:hypothetical protein
MAAISDLDEYVNLVTGGSSGTPIIINGHKLDRVGAAAAAASIAGGWKSMWLYNGSPAGAAAGPGAVATPDNTTAGSLLQADAGGSRSKWLVGGSLTSSAAGTFILYDRLLHISGLSGTNIAAQAVGGTIGRYTGTSSVGNELLVEIYTQIGVTGTTAVINYTDPDNNAAATPAFTIGGTGYREAQTVLRVPLAAGDGGVRAVTDIDLLATTGTAGDLGVTVIRPLMTFGIGAAGCSDFVNLFLTGKGPIEIQDGACLAWLYSTNSTTVPNISFQLHTVEK